MSQILDWLPPNGTPRFAIDAVWQSTLVACLGLAGIRSLARRPATRALLALVTIFAVVLLPFFSAAARSLGWGLVSSNATDVSFPVSAIEVNRSTAASRSALSLSERDAIDGVQALTHEHDDRLGDRRGGLPPKILSVFSTFWCLASAVLFVRLCASAWQTRKVLRTALPCREPVLLTALEEMATTFRVRTPNAVTSKAVASPTVLAFGRGVVVLPTSEASAGVLQINAPDCWRAILGHELAHVCRRDGWNRLFVEVAVSLLPWQPLLWRLRRDFLRHSEEACDDWAVASGADAIELASLLTNLVPSLTGLSLGAAIMNTDVKTRILRLLTLRGPVRPQTTWSQAALMAVVCSALVVGVALAQSAPNDKQPNASDSRAATDSANGGTARFFASAIYVKPQQPAYILEPPDVVVIEPVRLLPKGPKRVERLDQLQIEVAGTPVNAPIKGLYKVDADGEISLGPRYGRVCVDGLTVKEAIQKIDEHLSQFLREPAVAVEISHTSKTKQVEGQHLIGPDGRLNLGTFGQVHVAGMTTDEAREAIERKLSEHFEKPSVAVEVSTYNSKVYYVIVEGQEGADRISRFPLTGNETVLDAVAQIDGLRSVSRTKIWINRRADDDGKSVNLPVKLDEIMRVDGAKSNFKLAAGDRIFIQVGKPADTAAGG